MKANWLLLALGLGAASCTTSQMHLPGYASIEPGDFNGLQPDILVYCSVFDRPISFPTGVRQNPASPSEKPVFSVSKTKFKDGLLLLQMKDTHTQAILRVGHAKGLNTPLPKPDTDVLRENTAVRGVQINAHMVTRNATNWIFSATARWRGKRQNKKEGK